MTVVDDDQTTGPAPAPAGEGPARHVTSLLSRVTLAYAQRALGEAGVARILEVARASSRAHDLNQGSDWTSREETLAVARATAALTGDLDLGRRVGHELFRENEATGIVAGLRRAGDPAAVMKIVVPYGNRYAKGRVLEVVEIGADHVVVDGHYANIGIADPFFCGMSAGYYDQVPGIFGAIGVAVETECQSRGDERCRYHVSWTWPGEHSVDQELSTGPSGVARFEELQSMAAELATAADVSTVLQRITQRAGVAAMAPGFLSVARLSADQPPIIHHLGLSDDRAAEVARTLLAGEPLGERWGKPLLVDIATPKRHYGWLVALYVKGTEVSRTDRRLLTAYAGHATAALEAASAFETARQDRDTAQALLSLARTLAEVGRPAEVAARLAPVIPDVTRCDRADVWLWHEDADRLVLESSFGAGDTQPTGDAVLNPGDIPDLLATARRGAPFVLDREQAPTHVRRLMEATGLRRSAIVAITLRGEFLGVITAGFAQLDGRDDADLFERLQGLADYAAVAFDNARLLERVREQALHDALTGLPNRTLLEDRAQQALRRGQRDEERVAMLFIDLDRFKNVNDTLGHRAGDELINLVGQRLQSAIREGDTLARVGGDEFVVLLPHVSNAADASKVAAKLIAVLTEPFPIGDGEFSVSASIGVACFPEHGDDYHTLLQHADRAMYAAKEQGRTP